MNKILIIFIVCFLMGCSEQTYCIGDINHDKKCEVIDCEWAKANTDKIGEPKFLLRLHDGKWEVMGGHGWHSEGVDNSPYYLKCIEEAGLKK